MKTTITLAVKFNRLRTCILSLFIFFVLAHTNGFAQSLADSVFHRYSFIKPEKNSIGNEEALYPFYEKLYQLESKTLKNVKIVHIGDSHIQADFFSGMMRQQLQHRFGNAGRGLIFPYKVAHTNEPSSYQTSSNVTWETKRNIFINNPLPVGIGGITIKSLDSSASITLNVSDQGSLNYGFNKLTLFHQKGPEAYDFMLYDGSILIGFINSNLSTGGPFSSTVYFDKHEKNIRIKAYKRDSLQSYTQLYGLLLENDEPGILYHATGVNGAECRHCSASKYFFDQLSLLEPNLTIISLGTNEAFQRGFNKTRFLNQVDSLVKQVQRARPDMAILFTTPADSYRKKYKNPDMRIAKNALIEYCTDNHLAYWDLYEIMGGFGAMAKWKAKGLAAPDKVHFSRGGYELQGKLLYNAIENGYTIFKRNKHP
jgi:lysophospholipase L1-like esterase